MNYDELLKRGKEDLPESVLKTERFKIPKIEGHIQGNKTILANFFKIADFLGRDHDHFLKYILKELATPGEKNKHWLIMGSKVPASQINKKIIEYANKYVICNECGKPDTNFTKKQGITYIKCNACGARYPAR